MRSYFAAFLLAALIALFSTPLMVRVAYRLNALSHVGGRNVHARVTPRLGGVAIALAVIVPLLLLFMTEAEVARVVLADELQVIGIGFGAILLCSLGALDDIRGVRASYKLAVQVLCATAVYFAGFRINAINLPGVGVVEMGLMALPLTILWIVGVTNAVNLIDGLDGLAAGIVFFAAGTNFVVALLSQTVFVAVVMAALMGSLFGFLFFNFNPARIFMGDSGSYFLGFVLATMSLYGPLQKVSTAVSLLVPVLALGLPIFDTLFSIVRRLLERRSIFAADRRHLHHRLLDIGLTHRRAVLLLYAISLLFAASAIAVALGQNWQIGSALIVATIVIAGLIRFAGSFDQTKRAVPSGNYDALTERLRSAVPRALVSLAACSSTEEIEGVLSQLGSSLQLERLSIRAELSGAHLNPQLVQLEFPIAAPPGRCLTATWKNSEPPSRETTILLQLIADAIHVPGGLEETS